MSLSAETIIALLALLIACVPGLWFIVKHNASIRRWWSSNQGQRLRPTASQTPRYHDRDSDHFYNLGSSRRIPHSRSTQNHQTTLPFFQSYDPMLYGSIPVRTGSTPQQLEATFMYYQAVRSFSVNSKRGYHALP
ncbi:hypothetical protein BO86DRAFT_386970 [Aspergillus japonicus CBS 114.51]|uniref:Uncharacterized protein n=1 Tax=Aspergillus japonicus CBS 114.51 TaxID=1448312 RepID=A0A8T8X888_ASPJA|nr:hypothetical protein BO86DRAFT_386970 [Aspergillus japonicus CBS 114.51]RAH84336.1 hypothetical protein BO86DRAFT_386970 [Aspergillus japonicus CBS 114.51]